MTETATRLLGPKLVHAQRLLELLKDAVPNLARVAVIFDKERNIYTCPAGKLSQRQANWSMMERRYFILRALKPDAAVSVAR